MKELAFLIFAFLTTCIHGQGIADKELDFTIIPIWKNQRDTNNCVVVGFIETGHTIETGKGSTIYIEAKSKFYWSNADSNNNFDFGFIDPGTYKVKVRFFSISGSRPNFDSFIDSVTFKEGGNYQLQIRKGRFKKDTFYFVGRSFILPIYFGLDSAFLRPESKHILNYLKDWMNKHPTLTIEIGVHFDERCSKEDSRCLSCRRADSIKAYLVSSGIRDNRIVAKGYQCSKPFLLKAKTEEQHKLNRRTEVTVLSIE